MEDAGVFDLMTLIAGKFFGDDAFRDPGVPRPIVKEELRLFLSSFLAHLWNNMRRRVGLQFEHLQAGMAEANDQFDSAYTRCVLTS